MKTILSIGCSYALDLNQHYKKTSTLRFSYDGASIETILEMVKYLESTEEHSIENWVVGITQIGRLNKQIPKGLEWQSPTLIKPRNLFFDKDHKWCFFSEGQEEKEMSSNFPSEWWETEHMSHVSKPIEEHIRNYLNAIIEIQNILKDKKFVMFLMNNTLDGWVYKKDGRLSHIYSEYKGFGIPEFNDTFTLEKICPREWSNIDFSKFCLYEHTQSKFGGLDEYTTDKHGVNHFGTYQSANKNVFGQHPIHEAQWNFFNEVIRHRL